MSRFGGWTLFLSALAVPGLACSPDPDPAPLEELRASIESRMAETGAAGQYDG